MSEAILLEISDGLAHVTLNRPERLNAVDRELAQCWRDIAARITADESVRAVLLEGAGRAFCAGGDIMMMAGGPDAVSGGGAMPLIDEGIRMLLAAPVPIVAAVHGSVAGGGLGLMLTADYIVAAEGTRFLSAYAKVGLTPDLGVSTLLPAAIGERRALQLLLTDGVLDAQQAREWGMVAEVVPDASARAQEVAAYWLAGASAAYGQAKRLIRSGGDTLSERFDDEARTFARALSSDAARVRLRAFADQSAAKEAAASGR